MTQTHTTITLTSEQQTTVLNALTWLEEALDNHMDGGLNGMLADALNERADDAERQRVYQNSYYYAVELIDAALKGRTPETLAKFENWARKDGLLEY